MIRHDTTAPVWYSRKRWTFFGLPLTFTKYSVYNEKIIVDSGVFTKTQEEIRLYRVLDMTLKRTFWQRIFGLGTIQMKTSDKALPEFAFVNIKNSETIKTMLSDMVEDERDRKRVSMREYVSSDSSDDFDDEPIQ